MDVTTFPAGVLSMLGASTSGRVFPQAAEYITPVIDISQNLGFPARIVVSGSNGVAPGPYQSLFTIPQGQIWRILAGYFSCTPSAAATINGSVALAYSPGEGNNTVIAASNFVGPVAALQAVAAPWLYDGLMLGPGTTIGVFANGGVTGGTMNVSVSLETERFLVSGT